METITVNGIEYKILGFRQISNGDTYLDGCMVRQASVVPSVPPSTERLILEEVHELFRPSTKEDAENRAWCYVSDNPLTSINLGRRATLLSCDSIRG